jgi:hypothetical protein
MGKIIETAFKTHVGNTFFGFSQQFGSVQKAVFIHEMGEGTPGYFFKIACERWHYTPANRQAQLAANTECGILLSVEPISMVRFDEQAVRV